MSRSAGLSLIAGLSRLSAFSTLLLALLLSLFALLLGLTGLLLFSLAGLSAGLSSLSGLGSGFGLLIGLRSGLILLIGLSSGLSGFLVTGLARLGLLIGLRSGGLSLLLCHFLSPDMKRERTMKKRRYSRGLLPRLLLPAPDLLLEPPFDYRADALLRVHHFHYGRYYVATVDLHSQAVAHYDARVGVVLEHINT